MPPWIAECSRNVEVQLSPKDLPANVLRQSAVFAGRLCPQFLAPNRGRSSGAVAAGCLGDTGAGRASRAQPNRNVAEVMNVSRGWGRGGSCSNGRSALQHTLAERSIRSH